MNRLFIAASVLGAWRSFMVGNVRFGRSGTLREEPLLFLVFSLVDTAREALDIER